MQEPAAFCRAMLHEYERQWGRAAGHGVRHPLRLKMAILQVWCDDETLTAAEFEARLVAAGSSDDVGTALLADELLPMWRAATAG